jgi:hypothetical protein
MPGRKPTFKHDKNTGAYILKESKGGINWYNVFHKQAAHPSELHTKTPRYNYLYYITTIL